MKKLIIFFGLIGFLIFSTLNASALMGGHGSGGQGGSNAGHMGGNMGGEQDIYHYGSGHGRKDGSSIHGESFSRVL